MEIKKEEIIKYYSFLGHKGISEIRPIKPRWKEDSSLPPSFWIRNSEELINAIEKVNGRYNVYIGINERFREGKSDSDVRFITNIGQDIDAHESGEEGVITAGKIAIQIKEDSIKLGYKEPLIINSGRGFWVIHHISPIENTEENVNKIKEFGKKIQERYKAENIEIDSTVYNPSRIVRVPGTLNISNKDNFVMAVTFNSPSGEADEKLSKDIIEIKLQEYSSNINTSHPSCSKGFCSFMDYCLTHEIPKGERHKVISRNMALYISDHPQRELLKQQYIKIQKATPTELDQWLKNIDNNGKEKYPFSIGELVNFTKKYKIPFDWKITPEYQEWNKEKRATRLIEKELEKEERAEQFNKDIKFFTSKKHLAQQFLDLHPLFYDNSKLWWLWNDKKFFWEMTDEVDILNYISKCSEANTINSTERSEILEALKQESRLRKPRQIKKTWIQFKDLIIDIQTGEEMKATPKYFVTNPIPWKLNEDRFVETPIMDKIFEEWVGKEKIKLLYEIIAYSLLPDYPIHRLFCLIGEGMNGKSCFLRLLTKFIGEENTTATELDTLIASRFEITRLYKKLVVIMGETNFAEMSKTSIIKKLTGQDKIGFEYKNKNPFDDYNYAKILIATNNLPTTTDKTIGFYRRWCIIDFPNKFSEHKNILEDIPEEEYEYLAVKCLGILKDLLDNRKFTNEGTIEERTKRYEDHSDPIEKFMKEYTEEDLDSHIWRFEFEKKFNSWCKENRFRTFSEESIGKKMREKSIENDRKWSDWLIEGERKQLRCWRGIKWK